MILQSKHIELLAPARNLQCGIAAIDHGADAVYIGAHSFGARHSAGNSVEDIHELCLYAHRYRAKVYATVNTIIYDSEMEDALRLVASLHDAGVDAILVQDMGLLSRIRSSVTLRDVVLHASTQTDNRTVEKVHWLRSLGIRRVVLARELSLNEIKAIHEAVPDVELEVFVHGALCVSFSGQCYASQHCLGRSANRGECAQMCRMRYSLEDADGRKVAPDAYYLSLKDQCQIDNLEEILDAGAVSLKIEGRLKDEAYVRNVVAAYSQRLDAVIAKTGGRYCRASEGRVEYSFTPDLQKSFNRGYTDYFLHGRRGVVASFYTPKAIGEMVGKVKSVARGQVVVAGTAAFANGDGLCFFDDEGSLQGFRVNRAEGNRLIPQQMPRMLKSGTVLYRNQDQAFEKLMSQTTAKRRIPVTMEVELAGDSVILTMQAGIRKASAALTLESVQEAQRPQRENIIRQLTKLGNTVYICEEIDVPETLDKVFVPSSGLADLRRRTVEELDAVVSGQDDNAGMRMCEHDSTKLPHLHDDRPYLDNISNADAARFYGTDVSAYEVCGNREDALVMQCRHCLRYSLGHCVKNGGVKADWKEPLHLRLADGKLFRLEFDCRNCQMNVFSV